LTVCDGEAVWLGVTPQDAPRGGEPLQALRATLELLRDRTVAGLPPLVQWPGSVFLSRTTWCDGWSVYTELAVDDLGCRHAASACHPTYAAVDHHEGTITLIANAVNWNGTRRARSTGRTTTPSPGWM